MSVDLPRRRTVDAALLKTFVDQFVERDIHPAGDIKLFEELVMGLMDRIEPATAADILLPLRSHADTPPCVLARLRELRDDDAKTALGPGSEIAELSPVREDTITLDLPRLREMAADLSVDFDPSMRQILVCAAREDLALARILLDRDDPGLDPTAFFLAATRLERLAIVLDACRQALVFGGGEKRAPDPMAAQLFKKAASARDFDTMAELAATTLRLTNSVTRMIIADASGEALALLMAALGLDPVAGAQIFMNAPAGLSKNYEQTEKLVALMRATPQCAALDIVTAIAGEIPPQQARPGLAPRREKSTSPNAASDPINARMLPGAA